MRCWLPTGGELWDYVAVGSGKGLPIVNRPLPIVAITTTAGTGSETDGCGVITKEDTNEKAFIMHPSLFPVLAVVDAELMLTVPPRLRRPFHPTGWSDHPSAQGLFRLRRKRELRVQ